MRFNCFRRDGECACDPLVRKALAYHAEYFTFSPGKRVTYTGGLSRAVGFTLRRQPLRFEKKARLLLGALRTTRASRPVRSRAERRNRGRSFRPHDDRAVETLPQPPTRGSPPMRVASARVRDTALLWSKNALI